MNVDLKHVAGVLKDYPTVAREVLVTLALLRERGLSSPEIEAAVIDAQRIGDFPTAFSNYHIVGKIRSDQRVQFSTDPYRHTSQHAAQVEAHRLQNWQRHKMFAVFSLAYLTGRQ